MISIEGLNSNNQRTAKAPGFTRGLFRLALILFGGFGLPLESAVLVCIIQTIVVDSELTLEELLCSHGIEHSHSLNLMNDELQWVFEIKIPIHLDDEFTSRALALTNEARYTFAPDAIIRYWRRVLTDRIGVCQIRPGVVKISHDNLGIGVHRPILLAGLFKFIPAVAALLPTEAKQPGDTLSEDAGRGYLMQLQSGLAPTLQQIAGVRLDSEGRHLLAMRIKDLHGAFVAVPFLILIAEALELLQFYRLLDVVVKIDVLHSHV